MKNILVTLLMLLCIVSFGVKTETDVGKSPPTQIVFTQAIPVFTLAGSDYLLFKPQKTDEVLVNNCSETKFSTETSEKENSYAYAGYSMGYSQVLNMIVNYFLVSKEACSTAQSLDKCSVGSRYRQCLDFRSPANYHFYGGYSMAH